MYQQPKTWKDWAILLSGWLSLVALGMKGLFDFDITPFAGDIADFVFLSIFIAVNAWTVWKNTYASKKARLQKKALQAQGLLKK
jgi:preprotein translocase subunit SecF